VGIGGEIGGGMRTEKDKPMNILGIDPGTKCGWAIRSAAGTYYSGTWDLAAKRHEGGGMRFVRLRRYFIEALAAFEKGETIVAYEEVRRHLGADAAHIYGGIVGVITEVCESLGIPYQGVPVGTVKKHATGKGNSGKDLMILAAKSKWPGETFADDNEVDARWIAETFAHENSM